MKVTLLSYFSVGGVKVPKGTVYDSTFADLPDWVKREVEAKSPMIDVSSSVKAQEVVSPSEEEIKAQAKAEEAEEAEKAKAEEAEEAKAEEAVAKKKPAVKRINRKPKAK